jgi:probable HAF family extracellular repeat protein
VTPSPHIDLLGWLGQDSNGTWASSAHAINNVGQVVGESSISGHLRRAYRYTDGTGMVSLGELPGSPQYIYALGINATGDTVGYAPTNGELGYRYQDGTGMTPIGSFGTSTRVFTINNSGFAAGYSFINGFGNVGFTQANTASPLVPFGDSTTTPFKANSAGVVTGGSSLGGLGRAFVYSAGGSMTFLPVPADSNRSIGRGINDFGEVVGETYNNNLNNTGAFLWSSSLGVQRLATLPGAHATYADAINNLGWIVGHVEQGATTGVLWMPGQAPIDLNAYVHDVLGRPDITILSAEDINDLGQIVGQAQTGSTYQGYRLTIPAPPAAGALLAAGVFAARRRRRP